MNKRVEKIRDDLYVRKGMGGTYRVVYPLKDREGKPIKGNFKKALLSDFKESLFWLFTIGVILLMLIPGAQDIKEQCEEQMQYVYTHACEYCADWQIDDRPNIKINITHIREELENDG